MKAWLACAIWWLIPAAAAAQSVGDLRPPITISVGGGVLMPYWYPERPTTDLFVSVQVPFSESLLVEGQVLRSTSDDIRSGYFDNRSDRPFTPFSTWTTDHEAVNVGANLLMRMGGPRLKLFFGGGLGVHHAETRMTFATRCEPRVAGGCDGQPDTVNDREFAWSGPTWQLVGGLEAPIAPRLTAFGGARWMTTSLEAGDTGLGVLAGIRAALRGQAHNRHPARRS